MVKFAMAVFVVMLVSLLSLGWRVGLVVVAAIPLTLGAVFVVMMITDRPFDRIESVISAEELRAISERYKGIAGYDKSSVHR